MFIITNETDTKRTEAYRTLKYRIKKNIYNTQIHVHERNTRSIMANRHERNSNVHTHIIEREKKNNLKESHPRRNLVAGAGVAVAAATACQNGKILAFTLVIFAFARRVRVHTVPKVRNIYLFSFRLFRCHFGHFPFRFMFKFSVFFWFLLLCYYVPFKS